MESHRNPVSGKQLASHRSKPSLGSTMDKENRNPLNQTLKKEALDTSTGVGAVSFIPK